MTVDGHVRNQLKLSVEDLKSKYVQYEVVSALQCAGNRRHTMRTLMKEVSGIDWGDGAVMNCKWRGPRLRDILLEASSDVHDARQWHVAFACNKTPVQGGAWYGGSIELDRAMREEADVLVALEVMKWSQAKDSAHGMQMNNKVLPVNHGYPVRIIVPGVSGCRSVKWLDRITVQSIESENLYQRNGYKILPPEVTDMEMAKSFWDITPALQDMPVNSVIAVPQSDETVLLSITGTLKVKGYALPHGADGPVVHVEISTDDGHSWKDAEILEGNDTNSKWAWSLWRSTIQMRRGHGGRILSRATDAGGNRQSGDPTWTLRGVGYDGWGEARNLTII